MSDLRLTLVVLLCVITAEVKLSTDRCGSGIGKCDSGYCCSKYNWCGKTSDHCGSGCQTSYGTCDSSSSGSSSGSGSSSNLKWVGFRFSQGGSSSSFGSVPSGDSWVSYTSRFKSYFTSSAKGTVIVIVSAYISNGVTKFYFKPPSGYSQTSKINYSDSDRLESTLTKFDNNGIHVWLQVEPGNNDLSTLAKIVFARYKHHSCVKGFGVDLEWWYPGSDGSGSKITDSQAQSLVNTVRGINSGYTVFLKHWEKSYMPPNYRSNLIFVNDGNGFDNLDHVKSYAASWASKFSGGKVMFQIGYAADKWMWSSNPISFAKAFRDSAIPYNSNVGILWVDFTAKTLLDKI